MDLILWRHAEAVDGIPDHYRVLTAKGIKQAEKISAFLAPQLPDGYRVLASPSARAQQTAAILTDHFSIAPTIAPGASAHAVLQAAHWPESGGTVLVVGHQPTLGEAAAQLLGCNGCSISIKKGGVWWFNLDRTGHISLRLVISPDLL